jgi:hypothetical protein
MLPFLLLAAALALSACGGGGSSSGSDDEAAIETVIEEDATSTDASKCTEFNTQKFNEQQSGASGKKATEACEEEAESNEEPAESVDVSNIKVDGETATAEAAINGSGLNGQTLELELAKEGGDWKLNEFLSFADYDAKALGEGIEVGLEETGEIPASTIKCFAEGVSKMSQAEAEEITLTKNLGPLEKLGCE